jgi:cysteine-rich repeat protein
MPTGGNGFGGASVAGNSTTAGAGFGGSSVAGNANMAGSSSGGSTGVLGDPCSVNGALACHGAAQRLRLLCDGGVWKSNGTCVQSENCDQRTGVCAKLVEGCTDRKPGTNFCDKDTLNQCGPDLVTSSVLESCDGLCVETSTSASCQAPSCGDGKVESGEECDDGDTDDTNACTAYCYKAYCGDGSVYAGHELCDDGNNATGDSCSIVCGNEPVAIASGYNSMCGLGKTGRVQCWGYNGYGQLGVGDTWNRGASASDMGVNLPVVSLGTGRTVTSLAVNEQTACAVLDNGSVKCWGYNGYGQLGVGDTASRGVASNQMGDNLPAVPLGTGRTALKVGVGLSHTCAILDDHSLKCWGYNGYGQLGQGDTSTRGDVSGELGDSLPPIDLGTGRTAVAITAGNTHTCALLDDATIKCWGYNYYGQLGLGDTLTRGYTTGQMGDSLLAVDLGTGRTAKSVSAGEYHTCAVLDDATIKCWGYNGYGQLGVGDTATRGYVSGQMGDSLPAVNLGSGRTAKSVATGTYSTCAVLDNGSVKCWGYNYQGGLGIGDQSTRGDGTSEMGDFLPAVALGTGRTAKAVATGISHTCALLDNNTIKCWGGNSYGQLGIGASTSISYGDGAGELGDNLPYLIVTF